MTVSLPPLPFDPAALEPHMSCRTLEIHHDRHHKAYVDATVAAIAGTDLERASLSTIVVAAARRPDRRLFNNAAQAWNHGFFWMSLSPEPHPLGGRLVPLIRRDFGGLAQLRTAFIAEATGHFGSGWVWLVLRGDKLEVMSCHDADTPIVHDGLVPLLTCDVWEHAYYLDHQNKRQAYVEAFFDHLANWRFAEANLTGVRAAA